MQVVTPGKSILLLDSTPLGMLTSPKETPDNKAMSEWLRRALIGNIIVALPEIIDYEIRRELIRCNLKKTINILDNYKKTLYFLPVTSEILLIAANLWAKTRNAGLLTADPKALDIDVILAAQAYHAAKSGLEAIIVTANERHFQHTFPNAFHFYDILLP